MEFEEWSPREVLKEEKAEKFSLRGWLFELVAFLIFLGAFTASTMMFKVRERSVFVPRRAHTPE